MGSKGADLGLQWGGVTNFGQEIDRRQYIQFFDHTVRPLVEEKTGNFALGIVQVTKNNGTGWTRLLTSRLDTAIDRPHAFALAIQFAGLDALNAEGAFFHYTASSHGDIRIQHHTTQVGLSGVVIELWVVNV